MLGKSLARNEHILFGLAGGVMNPLRAVLKSMKVKDAVMKINQVKPFSMLAADVRRQAMNKLAVAAAVAVVLLATQLALTPILADDWAQFRGPGARGVSENAGLPDKWSETENVAWRTPIAGRGWSSPVVSGNRVFLTTVTLQSGQPEDAKPGLYFGGDRNKPMEVVHNWRLICFDLSNGDELWSETLHSGKPLTARHIKNSYASETPVTDGERVYALFGDVGLYCLSVEGDLIWSKELPPCKTRFDWGTAASPVLHNDRLYLVSDNEDESYLSAIDKRTGEQIWRKDRSEKSNWATPFIWENELRTEIITPGTGRVRSYDPDGNLLYEFGGCSSITIATPYSAHGLLYVTSGYVLDAKKPIFAIRPGASGDISLKEGETSGPFVEWCQRQSAPYNPSTIVYGDQLYVLYDQGMLASFDAKTGTAIYDKKRISGGRAFTTSPWAYDGKIFCMNEFGDTYVFAAGPEFRLLHTNHLEGKELCMATPAVAGSKLLLRTGDALYCITNK